MNPVYLIFAIMALSCSIQAQPKEYKVKAGEYPGRIIKADAYRFPDYRSGKLFNAAAKPTGNMLLNYNILLNEIRLINKEGDTLAIADPDLYPYIEIGNSQFHRDPQEGYFEIIFGKKTRLLEKQQFIAKQKDVVGSNGYGSTSSSPGSMVAATRRGSLPNTMVASVDVAYSKEAAYYFLSSGNEIAKASRSALLKWYPDNREEIKAFIKEERIKFESEADMIKLIRFIEQLN